MRKHYVLDTNVLLHDPKGVLSAFGDNFVVVPIIVTEELDRLKGDPEVGFDAREITRQLETLRSGGNIAEGVPTQGGGKLRIDANHVRYDDMPLGFEKKPDNIILLTVKRLQKKFKDDRSDVRVILVTKDINLRLKANAMSIEAEDYESDKTVAVDQLYSGSVSLPVSESDINRIHREGCLYLANDDAFKEFFSGSETPPNVCCTLETGSKKSALAIFKKKDGLLRLVEKPRMRDVRKRDIAPRNEKQCFAYDMVMDEDIVLATFVGKAGTGKTLMALLAGVELLRKGKFKKIIVFRPNVEVGEPMGFLPGNIQEKFEPWAKPIVECLNFALNGSGQTAVSLLEKGELEIQPFNYIRGATYMDALVIVDETQNLTPGVVKTAVTRLGERSKMVLTGDLAQIDNRFLDARSNGLAHVIMRFPGQEMYGHLMFTKSERSNIAEIAATIL